VRLFFFPPLRFRTPRSYDIGAAVGWFVHNPFVVGDTTFYPRAWSASSPTDPGSIRILYLAVSEGFPGAGPRISISRRFLGRVEDTMSAFSTTTYSRPPCATKKCRTASGWRFRATRKNVNGLLRRSPFAAMMMIRRGVPRSSAWVGMRNGIARGSKRPIATVAMAWAAIDSSGRVFKSPSSSTRENRNVRKPISYARPRPSTNPASIVSRDTEVLAELLRDFPEFDLGEPREIGDRSVPVNLLGPIDVRKDGRDGLLRQDEFQRGLGESHSLAVIDPPEVFRAFEPLVQKLRTLCNEVLVLGEPDRLRWVRLEDATRVRASDHHPLVDLEGDGEELPGRLLLEDVVVDLNAPEIAFPHRNTSFLKIPRAGSEREAIVPDLALGAEAFQGRPHLLVRDRRHVRMVQLDDIDVARLQASKATVNRPPKVFGGEVPRPARTLASDLRGDHHKLALVLERDREELLAEAVRVDIRRVEVVDPRIVGAP